MVMKRNAMRRNLRQSIVCSLGRYIAIAMIIALGAAIFVGLRMTKADMVATGQKYTDEQNMFDLRLVSSYGWGRDQLAKIRELDGIADAEGVFYSDLIVRLADAEDEAVYRCYAIPETINMLVLLEGRMPEDPGECLIDGYQNRSGVIGSKVQVTSANGEDALDVLTVREFTVVGRISSPLYMDMNRGTTSVGNGSIRDCIYVPGSAFDVDYYTEVHVTIPGEYRIYSDTYNDAMDAAAEALEPAMLVLAQERLEKVRADAEEAYQEGYQEYTDGLREYVDGVHEAYDELQDAYFELEDGQKEIADNEQKLIDGEEQIKEARKSIREGRLALQNARKTLADTKAQAYQQISEANQKLLEEFADITGDLEGVSTELSTVNAELAAVEAQISQIESGTIQWDTELARLESEKSMEQTYLDLAYTLLDIEHGKPEEEQNPERITELEQEIQQRQEKIDELDQEYKTVEGERQNYLDEHSDELNRLYSERTQLQAKQTALEQQQTSVSENLATIAAGMMALTVQQNQMESQFAAAEAQITSGEAQLSSGEAQLELQEQSIADGWTALEEGKSELEDGRKEYRNGKRDVEKELADASNELRDAREELHDARVRIDDMKENSLHILDRNTNLGYASLDSSSDIVAGVAKVFPGFFLLVAALVCITTMTRMVDEERTQIGTLKALGYSNGAIISKYLIYAGSSALLGCGLGVLLGSVVFPWILWEAYKIMLFIDDTIVLTFDPWLCTTVVASYAGVELLVTWYCCRRTLEEVPAELIRPKAPTAGKQLIFEKLPFWRKVSFLNKVTIRNIFRYRQRLAMMLVGIGGCTALLLTGFGLRDSIVNIVDFQFEDVTTYDMEVYFAKGLSDKQMARFRDDLSPYSGNILFFNQISAELDFENQTREIYMITANAELQDYIDFHNGNKPLAYPQTGEALLSSGVADALDVETGDVITLRDPDMQTMEVTVSGIYYNYVYNYVVVSPETVEKAWGSTPEKQMALVQIAAGMDPHKVSAEAAAMDLVMNVSVSEDLAFMVRNMMDALDLVVVVIVLCAAVLAATVLYNLTNININERIREIATIKVLGFNAMETAMYVFKENLTLSVMGAASGLLLGKILLDFVMSQIKINMVWFLSRALPLSYILSVAMTLLMAVVVDFVFYFKLQKINMAEALKSVE